MGPSLFPVKLSLNEGEAAALALFELIGLVLSEGDLETFRVFLSGFGLMAIFEELKSRSDILKKLFSFFCFSGISQDYSFVSSIAVLLRPLSFLADVCSVSSR